MATVIIRYPVADHARWRAAYDAAGALRAGHGCTGERVLVNSFDESEVIVMNEFPTLADAEAFATDPELAEMLAEAGVTEAPTIDVADRADTTAGRALARVDPDFAEEYPGADPLGSEAFINLVRVGERADSEVSRRLRAEARISLRAFALLATIDGLGGRATSAEIATHIPITTAAITSVVDTCEKRGWIVRVPDLEDRRKIQIVATDDARELLQRLLPGVHQLEARVMSAFTTDEKIRLRELLGKVLEGLAVTEREEPRFADAPRHRPARLDGPEA